MPHGPRLRLRLCARHSGRPVVRNRMRTALRLHCREGVGAGDLLVLRRRLLSASATATAALAWFSPTGSVRHARPSTAAVAAAATAATAVSEPAAPAASAEALGPTRGARRHRQTHSRCRALCRRREARSQRAEIGARRAAQSAARRYLTRAWRCAQATIAHITVAADAAADAHSPAIARAASAIDPPTAITPPCYPGHQRQFHQR
mmetsp:Transcript_35450/g.68197  ORF Transcript_35450/g.68197 Transcript_35450/m.68197 type:complete len:206 (-) Transcript_35450:697-1314(-)